MQGGTRDVVFVRTALAVACAAVVGLIAAPAALAGAPATDQYGSALPGGGNGGNTSGSTSGSSPSGGSQTIPVAPDSSSSSQQATGASTDSGTTKAASTDAGSKGGSSQNGHKADGHKAKATGAGSGSPHGSARAQNTGHSVPQIAADSAGDSWLPFFIGGMAALACAAAALVFFRNRRRTAQG